jgi:hypothetical protein
MNKLAIFVEGYTELQFVDRLIEEVAGANNVLIEHRQIRGGSSAPRSMRTITAAKQASGQRYYVLLFDCGGDEQVKSRIREEHSKLTKSNYSKIIGIRDLRPQFTRAELPLLETQFPKYIKTALIPVTFVVAVMEIEAWFLAEFSHYPKIDPAITLAAIKAVLGFDPQHDDMSQRPIPAVDLDDCYRIGGKVYSKGQTATTIAALDYGLVYTDLRSKIGYLDVLLSCIDEFLS